MGVTPFTTNSSNPPEKLFVPVSVPSYSASLRALVLGAKCFYQVTEQ